MKPNFPCTPSWREKGQDREEKRQKKCHKLLCCKAPG